MALCGHMGKKFFDENKKSFKKFPITPPGFLN
jgi:hypothetical protein